ncbi:MAG: Gfo/Idh/MocA family oxidoreductase [Azospirillaceae bacterium]
MKLAIIGAGWWAARAYIPLLMDDDRVSEILVCRPDRQGLDVLRDTFGIERGFQDAGEMLDAGDIAGVIVTSPHVLHAEHALMCIDRGLPVMIEKPMATTIGDARRVTAAARDADALVVVAYGWNFRPVAAAARRLMREGWIGALQHATCLTASGTAEFFSGRTPAPTKDHLFPPAVSTWADPARAGGYAWGQLTHALGLFYLLVEEAPVGAFARMGLSGAGVDLNDAGVVTLDNGATLSVSGTGLLPRTLRKQVDIRLHGSEGVLFVDVERERVEATRHDGTSRSVGLAPGDGDYGVTELLAGFVGLCGGEDVPNMADADVGRRSVETIDAMHRSALSGRFETI